GGPRANKGQGYRRLVADPCQGDLCHGDAAVLCHLLNGIDDVPRAVGASPLVRLHAATWIVSEPSVAGWTLVTPVLAGQPAATQRTPGQHAHSGILHRRHDLPLDLTDDQA